ncbi:MAG: bifunctional 2-C-methyl-D-erythritol 4-phosphate cytidylyltransferase/2-C-methyl-D-erythritol 2,4-cyclodiphosphate synthase [Pseudomonadota bacterium]
MSTFALLMAAGSGTRFGNPKQMASLGGRPLLTWPYRALVQHPGIDQVFVVSTEDLRDQIAAALPGAQMIIGGATRQASVAAGLAAAQAAGARKILVHDAARPLLPSAVIDRVLAALLEYDAATPTLPIADTLARGDATLGETVARDRLHRIQTPQGFRIDVLARAHAAAAGDAATDDAQLVRRLGGTVALVQGDPMLEKVTFPADLVAAEARLAARSISRSATGFDVHRLEAGEELWLGGVLIPHDKGLSGHSDADVALHALTDALLGTIGAGDIGSHFPPSDPQWKGASSDRFLVHAVDLIATAGGTIDFVDLTLICEAPKVGPHRDAMRARIAELLRIPTSRVSVKATTTERLGFTGRGEGIAAQACATVRVPEEVS